jgi:hypothetical protein
MCRFFSSLAGSVAQETISLARCCWWGMFENQFNYLSPGACPSFFLWSSTTAYDSYQSGAGVLLLAFVTGLSTGAAMLGIERGWTGF